MGFDVVKEHDKAIMKWRAEEKLLEQDLKAKERIEARVLDLYRNNDVMRGLIEKQVDTVLGGKVVLQAMPDYEALGVTREQALEWQKLVEREFHRYADSPENWISADRSMDFTQMCRSAYRSRLFTGEIFASREWRGSPLGYKTCFNVFSPRRVKTPNSNNVAFFGIELDKYGAAKAYHIEKSQTQKGKYGNTYDYGNAKYQRITKYNKFGWLQLIHIYEPFLPEYPRGISRLACALKKMKQLDRYIEADLDKAIITTNYVFAITSDEDAETVADILSGANAYQDSQFSVDTGCDLPTDIQQKREEIHKDIINSRYIETTGGQIAHLFKGEDIKTVAPPNTIKTSDDFAKGHLRNIANGVGISYEVGTGDFKGLSFSGGQLSLGIYEHSANIERKLYAHKFATMVYRAWLDEAMDKGTVPLLGEKPYWVNKEKYARCTFTGGKKVYIDPVKAAKANKVNLQNGTTSRTDIINENGGDIDSIAINRSHEASKILDAVEATATKHGLSLSNKDKLKIITDIIATDSVDVPDEITPDE